MAELEKVIVDNVFPDIADALRDKIGDTYIDVQEIFVPTREPEFVYSNNQNKKGTGPNGYANSVTKTDTVQIEGAASLQLTITIQTESASADYLIVTAGSTPSSSGTKLGGTAKQVINQTIDGDTVSFYWRTDSSINSYYGYHVRIDGVDENGIVFTRDAELIKTEKPSIWTPLQIANAIKYNISKPGLENCGYAYIAAGYQTIGGSRVYCFDVSAITTLNKIKFMIISAWHSSGPFSIGLYLQGFDKVKSTNISFRTGSTNYPLDIYYPATLSLGVSEINILNGYLDNSDIAYRGYRQETTNDVAFGIGRYNGGSNLLVFYGYPFRSASYGYGPTQVVAETNQYYIHIWYEE